ncbi:MAG: HEAT repeat domain-containing protein [Candidatus Acidiferrum sp.]
MMRPRSSLNGLGVKLTLLLIVFGSTQGCAQTQTPVQGANWSDKNAIANDTQRASAWKLLEEGARERNGEKRAKMIRALGLLGAEPEAVELAEAGLTDKEPEVRAAAARVLGEMGSIKSVPKLMAATSDKKISVAFAAAHSLLALKSDAGYEVYYAVMTGKRKSGGMIEQQWDELKEPKKAAEFAFEQGIGFVPYAGAALEAFQMLTKKDPSPVRAAAATALASDPDPRSGAALVQALKDKNWIVRVAALRAIAVRGEQAALEVVEAATQDKRDEVRFAAAAAVLKLTEGSK